MGCGGALTNLSKSRSNLTMASLAVVYVQWMVCRHELFRPTVWSTERKESD